MTLDGLMSQAALECIDTRERHLAIYTVGVNGYVCRNEGAMDESRALFKGVYRDCQAWIERQGISVESGADGGAQIGPQTAWRDFRIRL